MKTKPLRYAIRISGAAFLIALTSAAGLWSCSTTGIGGTGATGEVKGNVRDIDQRAQAVFKDMHIQLTSSDNEDAGQQQTISGMSGEEKVTVAMSSAGKNSTHVEVGVKKGTLGWDKDLANQVLSRIVQG